MPDTSELSETKRALLERYLQGNLSRTAKSSLVSTGKPDIPPAASVLAVQKNGSKRPFFFFHGQWNGQYFYCYTLANRLGPDQPFYALEPYDLPNQKILPTMEEMARIYLTIIRTIQPEGPYLLGGWCNGGMVAYEMARQLQEAGEKVDFLLLMDTAPLTYPVRHRIYYRVFRTASDLLHIGPEKQLNTYLYLKHILRYIRYRVFLRKPDPMPLKFKELRQDYERLYDWVALGYKPKTIYQGKIIFFWTREGYQTKENRRGWSKIETRNGNEVYYLPGSHVTTIPDHIDTMADLLYECISKVER
jgi:thioesterase domain-containing protein